MPAYKRGLKIGTAWNYRDAALGTSGNKGQFTDKDFGKPLKLVADSTYDVCAAGDEIEEIFDALAAQQSTVNNGYQIGTIRDDGQFLGIIDDVTEPVAVGKYVVSGAQAALGTRNSPAGKETTAYAKVRCVANADRAAMLNKWRIVSIQTGSGAVGTIVLVERVR